MPWPAAISASHRWLLPASVSLVLFVLMNLAKDNAPWPIHIGLAAGFLGCTAWTLLVHSRNRAARAVASPDRR